MENEIIFQRNTYVTYKKLTYKFYIDCLYFLTNALHAMEIFEQLLFTQSNA